MKPKAYFNFQIFHQEKDGKHIMTITPTVKSEGFKPKEIEFTQEQWEALKYHFAVAYEDELKIEKLTYIV